jgi:hypothetical protein
MIQKLLDERTRRGRRRSTDDSTAKTVFTTEDTENTEIRKRRIAEHFLLNSLLFLLLTSVISVSSVVAFLLLQCSHL